MSKITEEQLPPFQRVDVPRSSWKRKICVFLASALGVVALHHLSPSDAWRDNSGPICPQVEELLPSAHSEIWKFLVDDLYKSPTFKTMAIEWLGGAVRVRTESFDNMDSVGVDPRWEVFGDFHKYLHDSFPLTHATLKLTKVNTYGLLYHWEGSDKTLKPLFLAAHQDVVPVDPKTEDEWRYPPFSGYFDGERIWGRGSVDDKSGLIAIMSSIETFLKQGGFTPSRSVVLAFGFDEEAGGFNGAQQLYEELVRQFGENSMAMIVDEGGGFGSQHGAVMAIPGVGEKGSLTVQVEVSAPGGHSSIPPAHTSIGMLASVLVHFEDNPFEPHLERGSPMHNSLLCVAKHGSEVSSDLRKALIGSISSDKALRQAEEIVFKDPVIRSLVGTTQAIDIISGGVKSNALPEQAYAVVNHRIATQSNLEFVKARDISLLHHFAEKYDLSFDAFGKTIRPHTTSSYGSMRIFSWGTGLEPAPVTPTLDAAPYDLLSGTIKATYNNHRSHKAAQDIQVAPGIMSGNTDTRFYWNLSNHIFRYGHSSGGNSTSLPPGIHTVNEAFPADNLVEQIKFFTTLILNADESRSI